MNLGIQVVLKKSLSKEKYYSSLAGKKISNKEYDHVLKVWDRFEMKTYQNLHLKYDVS